VTAFFQVIERHRPGDTVQLTIQRNNQTLTINVKLGVLPSGS
jgi:S1-C subfamily serine protease